MKSATVLKSICCRTLLAVMILMSFAAEAQNNSPSTKPTSQQLVHVTQYQPEDTTSTEYKARRLREKTEIRLLTREEMIEWYGSTQRCITGKMSLPDAPGVKTYTGDEWQQMSRMARELAEHPR